MRKLPAVAFAGVIAAAVAGTAIAANSRTHVMNVPLPDGSVARIQYVGDIPPKVTVEPRRMAWAPIAPSFAGIDQMIARMNQQMQEMARAPMAAPGMNVAAYGKLPSGATSTSVVSYSNGGSTCTRTTEVVSQGAGKPPKVTTNVSGDCFGAAPQAPAAQTLPKPITRT